MPLLITIAVLYGLYHLLCALADKARERHREAEMERLKEEQAAQRAEAKEWTRRQVQLEREQMRLAKEQERQAAQLAKHEEQIAQLEFKVAQAESDIEFLLDRTADLNARMDYLLLQQSATIPGGREFERYQTKIVTLRNQIHTAERQLDRARFVKQQAETKLTA